jgi:hypothetical protein
MTDASTASRLLAWASWACLALALLAALAALLGQWAINAQSLGARDAGLALSLSFLVGALLIASLYAAPVLALLGLAALFLHRRAGLRLLAAGALVALPLALLSLPALAGDVRIPGTRVTLDPPAGFIAAARFAGFQDEARGASIMVTELPAPASQMRGSFTAANLQARGMALRSSEAANFGRLEGDLIAVTQSVNGTPFDKWMAVTGDGTTSVLIVATYPQALAGQLSAPMRAAVLSARWDRAAVSDKFEGLPFSVRETADLKFDNRMQNMLLMSQPGAPRAKSPEAPILVIGPSYHAARIADLAQFARQRIAQTAEVRELEDLQGAAATIAGRPAYEITAAAKDRRTGAPLVVYQAAILEGSGYYLVVGMAGAGGADRYLPQFRAIAHSLRIGP